ncbi:MAG: polysaccharide biosynthesis tyrosine autokinase [Opitutaceae bacterium]|nr:polysaccharide biosynthesis tyrosine autokinase [Opitutaceae bacterium]
MPPSSPSPTQAPPPLRVQGGDEPMVEHRTLRDYLIIFRERVWIALPIALLVAVSVGYYQARTPPLYMARATMQFVRPERVVLNEQVVDPSVKNEIELNTYLQILNSGQLRSRIIQSLTPEQVKILQRPYLKTGMSPPPVGALLGSVSIESIRNSFLIGVTVSNRDPNGAALVANKFVEQFIAYLINDVGGKNEDAVKALKETAERLRLEYEAAESRLQNYKVQHNLISLDNSTNIISARLQAINTALTSVRMDRINLTTLLDQIEKIQAAGGNLLEVNYISNYGNIPALRAQLAEDTKLQSILADRYLERHPKMIDLATRIDITHQQISRNIDQAIADLRAQLAKIKNSESTYEREFKDAESEQFRLGRLSVEYKSLENQAAGAKSNYAAIFDRLNQTTTLKSIENLPVRRLDDASPPAAPYSPNLRAILRTCIGLGLVVFCGVAIGLSFIDDRVKSAWDVEGFIGTHLLGIIPDLADVPDAEKHNLVSGDKTSPGAESFLSVYSAVKIQSKLDFPKAILVTSTIPGEGKTMISCNLASAFARHARRTLIIDCDMRRPMLHRHFKLTNESGLIAWFEAGAKVPEDPCADPTLGITKIDENLYLLRSGGRTKSPTELLENPIFTELVAALKRHFDLIVIDSPPIGAVTDSVLLAERVDEVVYVCRFNRAYRKHIRLYIKMLKQSKTELLGIVLNGLSPRRIEYYSNYRYYRSYKKYYGAQS